MAGVYSLKLDIFCLGEAPFLANSIAIRQKIAEIQAKKINFKSIEGPAATRLQLKNCRSHRDGVIIDG